MTDDKAAEAREGLLDSVVGKAKEVAGAVSGRDDLVEEGQLQQAEAGNRRAAVADEAVAEAKREEAVHDAQKAGREATEEQRVAQDRADQEQASVDRRQADEHAQAVREAERQQAADTASAEARADRLAETRQREAQALAVDADVTEVQASQEERRLEREAAAADQQAAQLRAETE